MTTQYHTRDTTQEWARHQVQLLHAMEFMDEYVRRLEAEDLIRDRLDGDSLYVRAGRGPRVQEIWDELVKEMGA